MFYYFENTKVINRKKLIIYNYKLEEICPKDKNLELCIYMLNIITRLAF